MKSLRACIAALAIATLGVLASPAAPAQASPFLECYTVVDDNGVIQIECFPTGALQEIDWCKGCPWLVDFRDDLVLPETFEVDVLAGIKGLALAANATDPREADRLHAGAIDKFTSAARALGSEQVSPGVVGYYDVNRRAVVESQQEWLAAADQDIADGIALLQRSFGSRDGAALAAAAGAEFDEAFKEISGKKAIG